MHLLLYFAALSGLVSSTPECSESDLLYHSYDVDEERFTEFDLLNTGGSECSNSNRDNLFDGLLNWASDVYVSHRLDSSCSTSGLECSCLSEVGAELAEAVDSLCLVSFSDDDLVSYIEVTAALGGSSVTDDCTSEEILSTCGNFIPIYGGYTEWGSWTESCTPCLDGESTGTVERYRTCTNPAPANPGNRTCVDQNLGSDTDSQSCDCPVNGGYTDWSEWGSCEPCSSGDTDGTQVRTRTCTNPSPLYEGSNCTDQGLGDESESTSCTCANAEASSNSRDLGMIVGIALTSTCIVSVAVILIVIVIKHKMNSNSFTILVEERKEPVNINIVISPAVSKEEGLDDAKPPKYTKRAENPGTSAMHESANVVPVSKKIGKPKNKKKVFFNETEEQPKSPTNQDENKPISKKFEKPKTKKKVLFNEKEEEPKPTNIQEKNKPVAKKIEERKIEEEEISEKKAQNKVNEEDQKKPSEHNHTEDQAQQEHESEDIHDGSEFVDQQNQKMLHKPPVKSYLDDSEELILSSNPINYSDALYNGDMQQFKIAHNFKNVPLPVKIPTQTFVQKDNLPAFVQKVMAKSDKLALSQPQGKKLSGALSQPNGPHKLFKTSVSQPITAGAVKPGSKPTATTLPKPQTVQLGLGTKGNLGQTSGQKDGESGSAPEQVGAQIVGRYTPAPNRIKNIVKKKTSSEENAKPGIGERHYTFHLHNPDKDFVPVL